jgi:SNF2 family DNA or RNA helicase
MEISKFHIFSHGLMDSAEVQKKLVKIQEVRSEYIAELERRKNSLTIELDEIRPSSMIKKLAIVDEPERVPEKCFRDYLLAEIMWLQNDITLERKWKSQQAKKFSKDVLKHRYNVERQAGIDLTEQNLRKVSTILAIEVEKFWKGVRQLAHHRFQKLEAKMKREENQKRLDELVDKTEEFVTAGRKRNRSEALDELDDLIEDAESGPVTPDESMELDKSSKSALLDKISKEMAEAAPTGSSFSTARVSIPVPTLIRASLREYQHIGMEWLAALHERGLNGILADEMGLGKTLQTIALLAHLAEHKGIWGPHLVVVPTSVMINWEIEFKKFLPGFKVMVYFGSPKERREKRVGWRKDELIFNVCICSYALVLQDALVFRKKNWHYLILDEAHQIKNFKSMRWQNLLTFKTERRLLLTGTPLQNDLIELWSLLHFLMPSIFTSHLDFQEWFSDPLNKAIEHSRLDEHGRLIQRLHSLIRPFLLRRLKKDVETQMPSKYEHVIPVALSRRQQVLYDEFLSHRETRLMLSKKGGMDYLGLMNVLMQLRKVCNHPDLLEPRPVRSPFVMALNDLEPPRAKSRRFENLFDSPVKRPFWFIELQESKYACRRASELADCREHVSRDFRPLVEKLLADWPDALKEMHSESESYLGNEYVRTRYLKQKEQLSRTRGSVVPLDPIFPLIGKDGIRIARSCIEEEYVEKFDVLNRLGLIQTVPERLENSWPVYSQYIAYTVPVLVSPWQYSRPKNLEEVPDPIQVLHRVGVERVCRLPDRRFLEWDCGKFRLLHSLLNRLRSEGHKVILFTQMSKMLDVIEAFANLGGFSYVRLDGSTKVTDRQLIVDRFNRDKKLFLFISSTRAGGVGINLTGADTVIFFDSDWNPAMDRQAMDRCHRIGQVRDVHVYRLVSEKTIEENIFIKQLQKRLLDHVVIDQGRQGVSVNGQDDVKFIQGGGGMVQDLLEGVFTKRSESSSLTRSEIYGTHVLWERQVEDSPVEADLFAKVEDAEDVVALRTALKEGEAERQVAAFDEANASSGDVNMESLHVQEEDSQYLALPAIVRRSVDLVEAQLVLLASGEQTPAEEDSEEWEEIEQAQWSSEDEDESVSE